MMTDRKKTKQEISIGINYKATMIHKNDIKTKTQILNDNFKKGKRQIY